MGSTRKKNAGRKRTLKYGRRRNYKKGSFKNRVKMTIRNGGGMKGGMFYRINPENNFKNSDTDDQIKEKLTRMFTYKIGEPSSKRDHMIESWANYITKLKTTDKPKWEKMTKLHSEIQMKQVQIHADSAKSYSRRSPSPRKGEAGEARPAEVVDEFDPDEYLQQLQDDVTAEGLTRELSGMVIKPQGKSKSGSDYQKKIDEDAQLQAELDRILNSE